jgi:hypothetical protein
MAEDEGGDFFPVADSRLNKCFQQG